MIWPKDTTDLDQRAGRGMLWSGMETFGGSIVSVAISVILARLISPQAFGMIALLQIFIAVGQMLAEAGTSQALVRRPSRTRSLESSALMLNLLLGGIFCLILCMCAPLIAGIYAMPNLTRPIKMLALSIPLSAACVVQTARLASSLRFSRLAGVNIISILTGGVVAVTLAFWGYGEEALVWQQLAMYGARAVLLWIASPWLPVLFVSRTEFAALITFSWKLLVSGFIDTVYENMYAPLIGYFFSANTTAMYWRADSLARYAPCGFAFVLQRVSLPAVSRIRNDRTRTRNAYSKLIHCSCWVLFPICAISISLAPPLFDWLLTDRWAGAVPLFRILMIALALYPLHSLNCTALNVYGRSDKFLVLEIVKKCIGVAILCICLPLGVTALCYGLLCSSMLNLAVNILFAWQYTGLGLFSQLRLMLPLAAIAATAGVCAGIVSSDFDKDWQQVLAGAAAGATVYLMLTHVTKTSALSRIISIIRRD
ncbi:MAG: lipopolysaccharide biosynthesis protein [Prevotella sp.]|nr:lipopolysaccharide biosynthesis protein [Prevotella sp.]MCM1074792.1 lipopolysaccharide biosynthesis protein [Ruminococcus sp.]